MYITQPNMTSERELLTEFIEKYKEQECLWKVTDKCYRNKQKRQNALKQLIQIMRKTNANANIDTVTKKINTLRSSFNKEHNKVKSSYRSRADTDDVHVPKLWYYDLLLFLVNRTTEARKPSVKAAVLNKPTTIKNEDMGHLTDMEPSSPCYSQSSNNTRMSQNSENFKKKKLKGSATKVLQKISKRFDTPRSKPRYCAFGEHVAESLRSMPESMAINCQKIINDAIFHANCGNLNNSSRIVTEYQHPQPQNSQLQSQPYSSTPPPPQLQQAQLQTGQYSQNQLPQVQHSSLD